MPNIESDQSVASYGERWSLGRHRLVCGDSTDPAIVASALGGIVPRLMVTDPPYGVGYDPAWREDPRLHPFVGVSRAKFATGKILNDDRCDWSPAWRLFPGDIAYVWHSALHASQVEASLRDVGLLTRSQIIWDKGRLVISRGHYHWRHETCWYAVRKGATANWRGDRKQQTIWLAPHRRSETGHAAQKPLLCMEQPIQNHTVAGDWIYDPFVGSGTTIIAAERLGRRAVAIELNPAYCAMAIARWQAETGSTAVRTEGDWHGAEDDEASREGRVDGDREAAAS